MLNQDSKELVQNFYTTQNYKKVDCCLNCKNSFYTFSINKRKIFVCKKIMGKAKLVKNDSAMAKILVTGKCNLWEQK